MITRGSNPSGIKLVPLGKASEPVEAVLEDEGSLE